MSSSLFYELDDKTRYCTGCGAKMNRQEVINYYHYNTGNPHFLDVYTCPKWRWFKFFLQKHDKCVWPQ